MNKIYVWIDGDIGDVNGACYLDPLKKNATSLQALTKSQFIDFMHGSTFDFPPHTKTDRLPYIIRLFLVPAVNGEPADHGHSSQTSIHWQGP